MAWVTQTFSGHGVIAALGPQRVVISHNGPMEDGVGIMTLEPARKEDAHALALIFRRVARRLEEIGKDLP